MQNIYNYVPETEYVYGTCNAVSHEKRIVLLH
jgi:hypothetical protein